MSQIVGILVILAIVLMIGGLIFLVATRGWTATKTQVGLLWASVATGATGFLAWLSQQDPAVLPPPG